MITTNDLKKGTRIKLANGWYGTLMDNRKGNTRLAEVEGVSNDIGSVYGHDIVQARVQTDFMANGGGFEWMAVTHTPQQIAARKLNADFFAEHYNDQSDEATRVMHDAADIGAL